MFNILENLEQLWPFNPSHVLKTEEKDLWEVALQITNELLCVLSIAANKRVICQGHMSLWSPLYSLSLSC